MVRHTMAMTCVYAYMMSDQHHMRDALSPEQLRSTTTFVGSVNLPKTENVIMLSLIRCAFRHLGDD